MLTSAQKNLMQRAISLKIKREEDVVNWLQSMKNITENEIEELLSHFDIQYTPSLDSVKSKKYAELSAICQAKIEEGISIEIDGVEEHFSYKTVDQNNIDDLSSLAIQTGLDQPYHADGGNCKLYTPEQILNIYIAQKTNKAMQTTYYNQLREMIKNEYVEDTDIETIKAITYGTELTGSYLENYNAMLAQSQEIINAVVASTAALSE